MKRTAPGSPALRTLAFVPAPSDEQVQAAYTEGQRLAKNPDSGYPLKTCLLYAVMVGTPLRRTRYQSFISLLGEDTVTAQQARARADLPDGSVEFYRVRARPRAQRPDLPEAVQSRHPAPRGQALRQTGADASGASPSQYPRTVGEIGIRFVGTRTCQFKVPAGLQNATGTLSFTDAGGKVFRLPVNLGKYR